ncbi:MAG: hypothetical protein HY268_22525 [Deltaproteobacteria bacterium]|nr:hypothetical protein [Deltaproteobacteria bacterium]
MAKNLTNVHGKLDKILQRMSKLDEQTLSSQRRSEAQLRLMTQMLGELSRMARDSQQTLLRVAEIQADVAVMANEARREAKESNERIAEVLAGARKH